MKQESGFYIFDKGEDVWLGKWFKAKEFQCKCDYPECKEQRISVELINRLEWLREATKSPIRVHSGFRCAKKQQDIRDSGQSTVVAKRQSTHERGEAADASSSGLKVGELLKLAEIKFKSIGLALNFLHLDLRDDKVRRWNY